MGRRGAIREITPRRTITCFQKKRLLEKERDDWLFKALFARTYKCCCYFKNPVDSRGGSLETIWQKKKSRHIETEPVEGGRKERGEVEGEKKGKDGEGGEGGLSSWEESVVVVHERSP